MVMQAVVGSGISGFSVVHCSGIKCSKSGFAVVVLSVVIQALLWWY